MTKHTYFRADDGTVFLPEPIDTIALTYCNNSMAYDACIKHDSKTSTNTF